VGSAAASGRPWLAPLRQLQRLESLLLRRCTWLDDAEAACLAGLGNAALRVLDVSHCRALCTLPRVPCLAALVANGAVVAVTCLLRGRRDACSQSVSCWVAGLVCGCCMSS
jgi:hypothetical protein